jgi:hypothetical protein
MSNLEAQSPQVKYDLSVAHERLGSLGRELQSSLVWLDTLTPTASPIAKATAPRPALAMTPPPFSGSPLLETPVRAWAEADTGDDLGAHGAVEDDAGSTPPPRGQAPTPVAQAADRLRSTLSLGALHWVARRLAAHLQQWRGVARGRGQALREVRLGMARWMECELSKGLRQWRGNPWQATP